MTATAIFVDVGQGNCTLLIDERGTGLLVDCPAHRADRAVSAARSHGLRELRTAFISHQDADHLGALVSAAEELQVQEIRNNAAVNVPSDPTEKVKLRSVLNRIDELAEAGRLINRSAVVGDGGQAGAFKWLVLSPTYSQAAAAVSPNHASIVLRVEVDEISFLLPADADGAAFERMRHAGRALDATVLAIPHHGADVVPNGLVSGMDWVLAAIKPEYAVVSCGPFSQYGHPTANTIAALAAAGVPWLCTQPGFGDGNGGSITFEIAAGLASPTQHP